MEVSNNRLTLEILDKQMNRLDSSEKMNNYLQNCMVYLFKIDCKEEPIQRRLIHLGGGAHITIQIPNITHIVVDNFDEEDFNNFNKYSNVFVVNTQWLREC